MEAIKIMETNFQIEFPISNSKEKYHLDILNILCCS
jgi:hypothetical protein